METKFGRRNLNAVNHFQLNAFTANEIMQWVCTGNTMQRSKASVKKQVKGGEGQAPEWFFGALHKGSQLKDGSDNQRGLQCD